ncbi:MAG: WYL domain-containing protein [Treponema sp.]|nr:WYL domain-containing protein [Treponema sp.]
MAKKKENPMQGKVINKKQMKRFIKIIDALKSGKHLTAEELLQRCNDGYQKDVTVQAIWRDVEALRYCFNAPIDTYPGPGKKGYYLIDSNYDFKLNNFSTHDVFYLSAAKTMLSTFKGSSVYDSVSQVIDFVTETQCRGRSKLLDRIAVPPIPRVAAKNEGVWEQVLTAMQENRIIEFDYNGRWNTKTTHRRVRAYQILLDDGHCFVFGYDETRDAERLFALNRIKNLIVSDVTFELPEDYEFASRCGGGKFGSFIGEGPVEFVVDFYGDSREYVKECIWADDQKLEDFDDEDRTRISFSCTQEFPVKEWILKQAGNAVPVSPDWFVEQWKDDVRGMAERAGLS